MNYTRRSSDFFHLIRSNPQSRKFFQINFAVGLSVYYTMTFGFVRLPFPIKSSSCRSVRVKIRVARLKCIFGTRQFKFGPWVVNHGNITQNFFFKNWKFGKKYQKSKYVKTYKNKKKKEEKKRKKIRKKKKKEEEEEKRGKKEGRKKKTAAIQIWLYFFIPGDQFHLLYF